MRPRQITNEEILKIARQVFINNGPHSTVEEISKIVGLSQPALFKRFGTKRNLLRKALELPSDPPWFETLRKEPDDRSFVEQLTELALEIHDFFIKLIPVMLAAQFSGIPMIELTKKKEAIHTKAIRLMSEWFQRCYEKRMIRNTDFNIAAMCVFGFIHIDKIMAIMTQQEHKEDSRKIIKKCADFIWNGLKPEK